jgi:hypothetical protein
MAEYPNFGAIQEDEVVHREEDFLGRCVLLEAS